MTSTSSPEPGKGPRPPETGRDLPRGSAGGGNTPIPGERLPVQVDLLPLPALEYAPFTYPRYRALLARDGGGGGGPAEAVVAVGARVGPLPVGLALAAFLRQEGKWLLLSVAVDRRLRQQGIGTRLLAACEAAAAGSGCRHLVGNFSTLTRARPGVEALLRRGGWSDPVVEEVRWHAPVWLVEKAEEEWAGLTGRARARGYRSLRWAEVDPDQEEELRDLTRAPGFDERLDPFPLIPTGTPELTLAILQGETPVGWIVGRFDKTTRTGSYPIGYVAPRVQRMGWLIVGIADAARRQAESFGSETMGLWASRAESTAMLTFMARRLAPVFEPGFLETRYWSAKRLAPETSSLMEGETG